MKILIMSDTHFTKNFSLDRNVIEHLSKADKIIHCGDFSGPDFYNFLNTSGKLIAVRGNNDHRLNVSLENEVNIELEGFKITVIHGHFVRLDLIHHKYPDSDIILFGHTHHPSLEETEGKLLINPGSLTSNRYVDYNSFAVMDLNAGQKPVVNFYKTL